MAILDANRDFPTPPFPLATAITCIIQTPV
jgi:hypothetical protein